MSFDSDSTESCNTKKADDSLWRKKKKKKKRGGGRTNKE